MATSSYDDNPWGKFAEEPPFKTNSYVGDSITGNEPASDEVPAPQSAGVHTRQIPPGVS